MIPFYDSILWFYKEIPLLKVWFNNNRCGDVFTAWRFSARDRIFLTEENFHHKCNSTASELQEFWFHFFPFLPKILRAAVICSCPRECPPSGLSRAMFPKGCRSPRSCCAPGQPAGSPDPKCRFWTGHRPKTTPSVWVERHCFGSWEQFNPMGMAKAGHARAILLLHSTELTWETCQGLGFKFVTGRSQRRVKRSQFLCCFPVWAIHPFVFPFSALNEPRAMGKGGPWAATVARWKRKEKIPDFHQEKGLDICSCHIWKYYFTGAGFSSCQCCKDHRGHCKHQGKKWARWKHPCKATDLPGGKCFWNFWD